MSKVSGSLGFRIQRASCTRRFAEVEEIASLLRPLLFHSSALVLYLSSALGTNWPPRKISVNAEGPTA